MCRCVQGELCCPAARLQDYQLVEFFIKRLKLWMGLTRTKEVPGREGGIRDYILFSCDVDFNFSLAVSLPPVQTQGAV